MGRQQHEFSDLFTELPVPPQAAGVVGTFKLTFYYISSTMISFLDLKDAILFLQGLLFDILLCVDFHYFFLVHFACILCV